MPKPKITWVTLQFQRGAEIKLDRAHLVLASDGSYYALPEGSDLEKDPELKDAYPLDPIYLEVRPGNDPDIPLYFYRKVLPARQ